MDVHELKAAATMPLGGTAPRPCIGMFVLDVPCKQVGVQARIQGGPGVVS